MTILERLRAATGPDRELDLAIGEYWPEPRPFTMTLLQQRGGKPTVYRFTASIDIALLLVGRMLPGHSLTIRVSGDDPEDANSASIGVTSSVIGATPALAILTALFAALEAKENVE